MSSTVAVSIAYGLTLQRERRERLFYMVACVVMLVGVAVGGITIFKAKQSVLKRALQTELGICLYKPGCFRTHSCLRDPLLQVLAPCATERLHRAP